MVTNGIGSIQSVSDYLPFGDTRIDNEYGDLSHNRKYLGETRDDETGLNYLGSRYENGHTAKFTSQDQANLDLGASDWENRYGRPVALFLRDPQQLNTYSYARNNPINVSDPGGDIIAIPIAVVLAGLTIYDTITTAQTLADPNASGMSKAIAIGLWASPLGEAKAGYKGLSSLSNSALKTTINTVTTKDNFRAVYQAVNGKLPSADIQLHHTIPQIYRQQFAKSGVNIDVPNMLRPIHKDYHQDITNEWRQWQKANPNPTNAQVKNFANQIDQKHKDKYYKSKK